MFAAGNHPDLQVVGLPADKATLPIELFIGDREHRNQEGLCHRVEHEAIFWSPQSCDRRRCRSFRNRQCKLFAQNA